MKKWKEKVARLLGIEVEHIHHYYGDQYELPKPGTKILTVKVTKMGFMEDGTHAVAFDIRMWSPIGYAYADVVLTDGSSTHLVWNQKGSDPATRVNVVPHEFEELDLG